MAACVAVVTGSNKGIGLEMVRRLCRHFGQDGVVYLTARDEGRGLAAVELLRKEGLSPKFHLLDVTDKRSIDKCRDHLEETYGGIEILINNAGIGTQCGGGTHAEVETRQVKTNFFGLLDVSNALIPILRSGGRVVNFASSAAYSRVLKNIGDDMKARWNQISTEDELVTLINEFLVVTNEGANEAKGWTTSGYGVSKLGVIVLTKIQAELIQRDTKRSDILINSCCPGYVRTDMSAHMAENRRKGGKLSVQEGADTPLYLALLPRNAHHPQPHGCFVVRRQTYDLLNDEDAKNYYENAY